MRAFERTLTAAGWSFFRKDKPETGATPAIALIDAETGSTWNFEGKAIAGPLAGRQLKKLFVLEDYWFDWRIYHPDTTIYEIGPG